MEKSVAIGRFGEQESKREGEEKEKEKEKEEGELERFVILLLRHLIFSRALSWSLGFSLRIPTRSYPSV